MLTVQHVCQFLEQFAPASLAEEWDNVGLLVGDARRTVARIMTCLTVTPSSAAEAVEEGVDLIVTHHPLPFRPLKRLTTETTAGRLLLQLIQGEVAVYSPHTAFDSAAAGINQHLADGLGLIDTAPLVLTDDDGQGLGAGRFGRLPGKKSLLDISNMLKDFLSINGMQCVGSPDKAIRAVGVACGSAGQLLEAARDKGCDLLVTGETSFHTCLEAEARDMALLLPGHFASERFAVEQLARVLAQQFQSLTVWSSRREADPLRWI
jgi:dinuclear metal center YbgI/SA1388 family protein